MARIHRLPPDLANQIAALLLLLFVAVTISAAGPTAQRTGPTEAGIKAMADEIRRLPALPVASSVDAARWDAFLRRIRESRDTLLVFGMAASQVPVGTQPSIARALQLLATGRTADGSSVGAVDLSPIADDLASMSASFADSRETMLAVLATIGPHAAIAERELLAMLDDRADLDDNVRIGIAEVFAAIGPQAKDALPALQQLFQESKGQVRSAARTAYAKIAGSDRNLAYPVPGGILLLAGYEHVREQGIDSWVGRIRRVGGGLQIGYDVGGMAGLKADEIVQQRPFLWSRKQLINGQRAVLVMQEGGYLTVTFERDRANFEAYTIRTQADLTDVMLMLWTYTAEPWSSRYAPEHFKVRLDTSKGAIVIAVHSDWATRGAQRFYELVRSGYYNGGKFFRVDAGTLAQFGIAGNPALARTWRQKTIPDDEDERVPNRRGTVAFDFKEANSRTTQVFINLKDSSSTYEKPPFVVFGEVIEGMDAADKLYATYGDKAGGGMRDGQQDVLFNGGDAYLRKNFPLLDYIKTARVVGR
jgi:cyclophilin family peptidyl-prolyl cis-trans isomerase